MNNAMPGLKTTHNRGPGENRTKRPSFDVFVSVLTPTRNPGELSDEEPLCQARQRMQILTREKGEILMRTLRTPGRGIDDMRKVGKKKKKKTRRSRHGSSSGVHKQRPVVYELQAFRYRQKRTMSAAGTAKQ